MVSATPPASYFTDTGTVTDSTFFSLRMTDSDVLPVGLAVTQKRDSTDIERPVRDSERGFVHAVIDYARFHEPN